MANKIYLRWVILVILWFVLLYCPWWLWLILVLGLTFKFSYYLELLLPALWYDVVFGLASADRFGTQFVMTFAVLIIIWSVEQIKKLLIFYQ
ncbi:MAG: hypothetical protein WCW56_00790 [Candidatus Paceibacterota bacterium]|jgi:hypothetical protein